MAHRLYLTNYCQVKAIKVTPKLTEHGLESSLANKRTVRWLDFYRDLIIHVLLITFSCSHHVSAGEFESAVAGGFSDAKRSARIIRRLGQGADHPILLNLPETSYLKGLLLHTMAGR